MDKKIIASPKHQAGAAKNGAYHYYAGFNENFVNSWLDLEAPNNGDIVFDPWNGSGTTTAACSKRGICSIGVDLNPFMKSVAMARLATVDQWQALAKFCSRKKHRFSKKTDKLNALGMAIFQNVFDSPSKNTDEFWLVVFLIGSAIKSLSKVAQSRNPTWFSIKRVQEIEVTGRDLFNCVEETLQGISDFAATEKRQENVVSPKLIVSDMKLVKLDCQPKFVLTSPPYLTRIDYVQKTLPETMFALQALGGEVKDLRRNMMGSVLTSNFSEEQLVFPEKIQKALKVISSHTSKASSTYYSRFFTRYFSDLTKSLGKLTEVMSDDGSITLVTQGSYYKEYFVDLPDIIVEAMDQLGWQMRSDVSFRASNSLAQVNRRAYASTQTPPSEVVQIFGKSS